MRRINNYTSPCRHSYQMEKNFQIENNFSFYSIVIFFATFSQQFFPFTLDVILVRVFILVSLSIFFSSQFSHINYFRCRRERMAFKINSFKFSTLKNKNTLKSDSISSFRNDGVENREISLQNLVCEKISTFFSYFFYYFGLMVSYLISLFTFIKYV